MPANDFKTMVRVSMLKSCTIVADEIVQVKDFYDLFYERIKGNMTCSKIKQVAVDVAQESKELKTLHEHSNLFMNDAILKNIYFFMKVSINSLL